VTSKFVEGGVEGRVERGRAGSGSRAKGMVFSIAVDSFSDLLGGTLTPIALVMIRSEERPDASDPCDIFRTNMNFFQPQAGQPFRISSPDSKILLQRVHT
jgi:hypothetical protein